MKKISLWFIPLLLAMFCLAQPLTAQETPINFKNYSTKDGLSSASVYSIIKDSFGFIWLATEDGLNRFDGTNFKIYRHNPANPHGLKVNHITALHEDKKGRIWIGTNGGGLSYYDRNKDSIFNYVANGVSQVGSAVTTVNSDKAGNVYVGCFGGLYIIDAKTGQLTSDSKSKKLSTAVNNLITFSFLEDSRKRKWVGTNFGLFKLDPKNNQITVYRHEAANPNSLQGNEANKIVEDQLGNIWVVGNEGLNKLMADEKGFTAINASTPNSPLSSNTVFALAADNHNRLWIGTQEGLDILDIKTNTIKSYLPDNRKPSSISSRTIRSFFIDTNGIYWVGSFRGGLHKYDENFSHFTLKEYNAFDPFGLKSPLATSFAGYKNNVFVGTDGGGLQLYDPETGLLNQINLPMLVKSNKHDLSVLALEMAMDGRLWVGTYLNGLYCYNPATQTNTQYIKGSTATSLNNNDIFCLKEDRNKNIWIGTHGSGINVIRNGSTEIDKYVNDPSKPNDPLRPSCNFIRCFEEDAMGNVWIATYGGGISVYDIGSRQFTFYNMVNSGLPSDYVMAIKHDSKGNIWIGTTGNGMGVMKKGSNKFTPITEKDGLVNGSIHKIIEDDGGNIWISTNVGLSCYNPITKKFTNYTKHNGLQAGAFMPRSGTKLPNGELFFGGQNGFNHFNPASFKTNKNKPPIVFTNLVVDNQLVIPSENSPIELPIQLARQIHLGYKQSFSIGFEALDFTVPAANQYEYMLKGFNTDWISAGKEHSANYANIPPGTYTFTVRASNNDGVWNKEGQSIKIIVAPPIWATPYAYLTYILLFGGGLYFIRRQGIKKIQMRYAIEQERKEAKQLIDHERKEAEYLHKLDHIKIKFLTNLSHEFKTPISLIMGPVDSLIGYIKEEHLLSHLNLIKRNSRRLLNLVNQLLDFRKMEERELKLVCNEGDLIIFVKDICDSFNDLAQRKKIEFSFYSSVPTLTVLFDHDKVERILFNILSNAFKFTAENGNIVVNLDVTQNANNQNSTNVTISIKDSGIGIPQKVQAHIFESFFQHEAGLEILNHGTGIGLSITKEFVQLHGGTIGVESEEGKGSNFIFNLLLLNTKTESPVNLPEPIPVHELVEENNSRKKNQLQPAVLIVEDDDDFRFYLKENLKNSYRIFEAPNGKEGWQRALFHHPDLIVCDVQMPIMNGMELVQKLKADKRTKHIPLILLTAANTSNGALDGIESGAIDYMTKPFEFALLMAKIHNILLLNKSYKDTYSKQVMVSLPATEVVPEKDKFLQRTLSYIYQNIDNPQLSVEFISDHMNISRASLYNRLLEYTGMSPVEFIRTVKLEKAKELLEKSDMSIIEIANSTGFANPNYFTKVFRTKYNVSPTEYQAGFRS